jgi:hypothetical protein
MDAIRVALVLDVNRHFLEEGIESVAATSIEVWLAFPAPPVNLGQGMRTELDHPSTRHQDECSEVPRVVAFPRDSNVGGAIVQRDYLRSTFATPPASEHRVPALEPSLRANNHFVRYALRILRISLGTE